MLLNRNVSENTLLGKTNKILREKNAELFAYRNHYLKNRFLKWATEQHSYQFIFILMGTLVALCFCPMNICSVMGMECLHWTFIDKELADTLIDNRISNVVTITSITLAVAAVLLNNFALKNKETYDLLFKITYLYPILYYVLMVIGVLILVSFFRNLLYDYQYINLAMLSMLLIILILISIGFLFSKIIQVTNPDVIYKIFADNFISIAMHTLYFEKLNKVSLSIYKAFVLKHGKIVHSSYSALFPKSVTLFLSKKNNRIVNVDLKQLDSCLNNLNFNLSKNQIEFIPFGLNDRVFMDTNKQLAFIPDNTNQFFAFQNAINDCVKIGATLKDFPNFETVKLKLYQKTKDSIETKNNEALKYNISIYKQLFDLYFKNFKSNE